MDFDLIQDELIKVFQISKDDIWYFGRNIQSEFLQYSIKVNSITPELITRWASSFGADSFFRVSKEFDQSKLTLIVTITDRDYNEFFKLKNPDIILDKMGIVQNEKGLKCLN